jgi:hypothetical protein
MKRTTEKYFSMKEFRPECSCQEKRSSTESVLRYENSKLFKENKTIQVEYQYIFNNDSVTWVCFL